MTKKKEIDLLQPRYINKDRKLPEKTKKKKKEKGNKVWPRSPMRFYDVRGKRAFSTGKYRVVAKNGYLFAVADAPSGIKSWRIIDKKTRK